MTNMTGPLVGNRRFDALAVCLVARLTKEGLTQWTWQVDSGRSVAQSHNLSTPLPTLILREKHFTVTLTEITTSLSLCSLISASSHLPSE